MARRSSARLRSRQSPAPQRVSLSHDAPTRTPRTAPSKLFSVSEADEVPGAFPQSPTPRPVTTPQHATPIQPADKQMHPQLHHASTVQPAEEARHLGFFTMPAKSDANNRNAVNAATEATPSKSSCPSQPVFTFRREHSLQLSPAAKQLMLDTREETARIRDQMAAESGGQEGVSSVQRRKLTEPKSKKGRFSDAHTAAFSKMASIANHASSFRAQPKTTITVTTPSRERTIASTLKRSPSKAELDSENSTPKAKGAVPSQRSTAMASPSSAKRVKRTNTDDVATGRKDERTLLSTPARHDSDSSAKRMHPVSTPSIKTRIPGPFAHVNKPATPKSYVVKETQSPQLFNRSATKANIFPPGVASVSAKTEEQSRPALLSQGPLKSSAKKKSVDSVTELESKKEKSTPLLLRSPSKKAIVVDDKQPTATKTSTIPMFLRSPSKIPLDRDADKSNKDDPNTTPGKSLLSRFNLLRATPKKGILRTPQRLYSDDPEKIAAGTHLATPEKNSSDDSSSPLRSAAKSCSPLKRVDFTSSTKARQLEQEERESASPRSKVQSKAAVVNELLSQPKAPIAEYPTLPLVGEPTSPSPQKRRQTTGPVDFTFHANEQAIVFGNAAKASGSPARPARPVPTIRHVSSDAVVRNQAATGSKKRKFEFESTISMPKENGYEKENTAPTSDEPMEEGRPAKRLKSISEDQPEEMRTSTNDAETKAAPASKASSRVPTLGVKPKGSRPMAKDLKKRPSTISQARLNALSQPKRRA